jgi:hypothetical protein
LYLSTETCGCILPIVERCACRLHSMTLACSSTPLYVLVHLPLHLTPLSEQLQECAEYVIVHAHEYHTRHCKWKHKDTNLTATGSSRGTIKRSGSAGRCAVLSKRFELLRSPLLPACIGELSAAAAGCKPCFVPRVSRQPACRHQTSKETSSLHTARPIAQPSCRGQVCAQQRWPPRLW